MSARANTLKPICRAAALLFAACVLCALLPSGLTRAFAEDAPADNNIVNPHQTPDSSFIYDTSIIDLSSADSYFDNQTVQVTGEAVGDNIKDDFEGRYRWITLSAEGDSATIAVHMTNEAASKIDTFGSYNAKGTTLQVRGIFHLVCSEHEGLSDLHAEVVTVVAPGEVTEDVFDFVAFIPGIIAVVVGLVMMGIFYWLRERQR